jgi:SAM-dependent methyltransferase
MMDPADRARNLANWEGRVPIHATAAGYDPERYVTDPARLSDVVAADAPHLGDLTGLDVVHLQCHIGTDTISLARLGATVTGVDFSPSALAVARRLSERSGTPATFVEADVHDAVAAVGRQVDLVYTSIGTICWLPSVARWAEVVAGLLRPGGRLYLRDAHPMLMCVDETRDDGLLVLGAFPYFERAGAQHLDDPTTYAGEGEVAASATVEWAHGLGELVQAVLDAGLQLTRLHEGDTLDWCFAPWMEQVEPGVDRWRLPAHQRELCPVEFTLEAVRPA